MEKNEKISYAVTVSPEAEEAIVFVKNTKVKLLGQKITVNSHEFFVVPINEHFVIYDLATGRKMYQKYEGPEIQTYEQVMQCFELYGIELERLIHDNKLSATFN